MAAPLPRVSDGDLAAWVAEGLVHDTRNSVETEDALLLRNGRRADMAIADEVTNRLTAAGVQGMVVSCSDGAVVVRGQVSDAARRDKAATLAGDVPGVHSLRNLLRLPDEKPVVETPTPAAPASHAPGRSEPVAFLTHDGLAGRGIVVDVNSGVAHLAGDVCSQAAREYALNAAGRVPGIRAVRSDLSVRPSNPEADRRLALLVHRVLTNDVVVQTVSNAILVTVQDGVLRLSGGVRDEDQKAQAGALAADAAEVFAVINDLTVDENLLLPPIGRISGFKQFSDY